MSDFDALFAPIAVAPDALRTYRIPSLPGVELTVAIAGEANLAFWSAVLTGARGHQAGGLDPQAIAAGRVSDADLWARYVVRGWKGIKRDDGSEAAFSVDTCRDFLIALARRAPHAFDALKAWTKDPDNFTSSAVARGLEGNS